MNTGIYEHLFGYYPANDLEDLELDVFRGVLIARSTLPYTELLDEGDIFNNEI